MEKIKFSDITAVALPRERVYRRLGYHEHLTRIDDGKEEEFALFMHEALRYIHLRGLAVRMGIRDITDNTVLLEDKTLFESRQLSGFLKHSDEILVMAVTAGAEILRIIRQVTADQDFTRAVIFDAVASEMTDSGLDWIMDYFQQSVRRYKKHLTSKRFSAGYGDFALENQSLIYKILGLEDLGVTLSTSYMLIPEKSVTALAGISGI